MGAKPCHPCELFILDFNRQIRPAHEAVSKEIHRVTHVLNWRHRAVLAVFLNGGSIFDDGVMRTPELRLEALSKETLAIATLSQGYILPSNVV